MARSGISASLHELGVGFEHGPFYNTEYTSWATSLRFKVHPLESNIPQADRRMMIWRASVAELGDATVFHCVPSDKCGGENDRN